MKKNTIVFIWGVLMALFLSGVQAHALPHDPVSTLFYYLKIDTGSTHMGYLRVDSADMNKLVVDHAKGDHALWRFYYGMNVTGRSFCIENKLTGERLAFDLPEETDVVAVINGDGVLNRWDNLFDYVGGLTDTLKAYYNDECYYLSYSDDYITLSRANGTKKKPLVFSLERAKYLPEEGKSYRLLVDTIGAPDVNPIGYLSADTLKTTRRDSLAVSDTLRGDLSLWEFAVDKVLYDTTWWVIRNKATETILAFDVPASDTIAKVNGDGELNSWLMPFFKEDGVVGHFTTTGPNDVDYYLGLKDTTVMLVFDKAANYKPLTFVFEEDGATPIDQGSSIVDSMQVYKVKYLKGPDAESFAGSWLGVDEQGQLIPLDAVYAHIPNGQFVVYRENKYNLMNRLGNQNLGIDNEATDSLSVVLDDLLNPVPGQYTNGIDTFEIVPITGGNIDLWKQKTKLGYKFLTAGESRTYSYALSYNHADTLQGFTMGYEASDSVLTVHSGDTVRFLLEHLVNMPSEGAPTIANIPHLNRDVYTIRLFEDTTLYVSIKDTVVVLDTYSHKSGFYLKEDIEQGSFRLVEYNGANRKLLVDSTKRFYPAPADTIVTHAFTILQKNRKLAEEPDENEYLKDLKEIEGAKGAGHYYEFGIPDPSNGGATGWLTMNYYGNAVLAREGESMLRAGSYTPEDLRLWVDTARGPGFNPDKPSFYIVYGVERPMNPSEAFHISGYYLHVMDSTSLADFDDYVVYDDDGAWYNRANFVKATRQSANELKLGNETLIGENNAAANEYRFYLQKTDTDGKYYIVTEDGYGDGGKSNVRGYLSVKRVEGVEKPVIYFGPREGAEKVTFSGGTVANEVIVIPPVVEEIDRSVAIVGQAGQVHIRNAAGQEAMIYNVLGQAVVKKTLSSDNEQIPASRGILIVKVGAKTQKVVVK